MRTTVDGMGGNGMIFAFVVVLWAAYFVPLALRRYDEAAKSGTIDKLSSLTKVVRRSDQDEESPVPVAKPEPRVEAPRPHAIRESSRIAARRRRNTLLTLIFALAVTAGAAAFGYIPWWSLAIPGAIIVAWLVACRIMVRSELGLSQPSNRAARQVASLVRTKRTTKAKPEKRRLAVPGAAQLDADDEETVVLSHQYEDVEPDRPHVMEKAELPDDALDEQLRIAVPVSSLTGDALWDPLPVTVPTYVTKPRVGRTVRTIDFSEPGTWSSGHVEGQDVDFPVKSDAEAPLAGNDNKAVGE